jgi:alpha-L-rhamnosidase
VLSSYRAEDAAADGAADWPQTDIARIDGRFEETRNTFDSRYWKGEFYKSQDVRAVNAGLADRSKCASIYDTVLTTRMNASNFFETMIPCSFTTLWEQYDRWWASRRNAFDDGSSLNHGWNPPALLRSQTIAGISPTTPGWGTYQVLPKEALLTSIQVVVPSIKGDVTVDLKKSASEYALSLTSPSSTTAILGIPG